MNSYIDIEEAVQLDTEAAIAIDLTQVLMKRLFPDELDSLAIDCIFGYTIGEMIQVIRSAKERYELM
jgi:hypothetical protein